MDNAPKNSSNLLYEVLKQTYENEIERKDKINANISVSLGLIGALVGVELFLVGRAPKILGSTCPYFFWFFFFVTCVFVVLAAYFFIRVLSGYTYHNVYPAKMLMDRIADLETFYEKNKPAYMACGIKLNQYMEDQIYRSYVDQYSEAAELNYRNNNKRIKYRRKMYTALVIGFIFFGLNLIPLAICGDPVNYVHCIERKGVKEVKLNKEEAQMNPPDEPKPSTPTPEEQPPDQPSPPEPPPGPPPDQIQEDEKPPPDPIEES